MINILSNPSMMTKIISFYILALSFTGAMVLAAFDYATGKAIPTEVWAFLSGAIAFAVNQAGLHQGLVMVNTGVAEKMKQQLVADKVASNGG